MTTSTTTTCRVALYADDPISRAGISAALERRGELTVVDEGAPGDVAVLLAQEIDERTQQQARQLHRGGSCSVVVVVAHIDDQGLLAAVEAGVCGVLRRSEATPDRLSAAIRDARAGNGSMPSDLLGRLMRQVTHLQDRVLGPNGMHLNGLSDREVEVLRLVADGFATGEIAAQLAYSERTIKNIIQDITSRLHLRNRSHAVAYALRQGII
ncbi:response regulator transcription factor [Nitriliruptor alkaliphilus]|uniref:response regulator transcription factor n=1 Tax=Nitriliruptor alkaliphilus TaxID=427918 RepID=UPI000ADFB123|nr:response regulator transcription factor [Nitriliruptor alkaliphilus]